MNDDELLVAGLREEVGVKLVSQYEAMLAEKVQVGIKNPDWASLLEWLRADPARISMFGRIARQISIDSLASTLAVLDGNAKVPGFTGDLRLLNDRQETLNRDLVDMLWEMEENDGKM